MTGERFDWVLQITPNVEFGLGHEPTPEVKAAWEALGCKIIRRKMLTGAGFSGPGHPLTQTDEEYDQQNGLVLHEVPHNQEPTTFKIIEAERPE